MIHEFAHAIHSMGLRTVAPTFQSRLSKVYQDAKAKGLWKDTYAISNISEYWAEGVQSWFDTNRQNDSSNNHVDTRAELKSYDPRWRSSLKRSSAMARGVTCGLTSERTSLKVISRAMNPARARGSSWSLSCWRPAARTMRTPIALAAKRRRPRDRTERSDGCTRLRPKPTANEGRSTRGPDDHGHRRVVARSEIMTGGTLADRVRDLRSADRRGFDLIGQFTLRCRRTGAGSYPATTSPSEVRGAIVRKCRSGRSRPWPRIRAKQALAPTGPIPLSGGTWREVEASASSTNLRLPP